jgi:hypothetical protein
LRSSHNTCNLLRHTGHEVSTQTNADSFVGRHLTLTWRETRHDVLGPGKQITDLDEEGFADINASHALAIHSTLALNDNRAGTHDAR